MNTERYKGVCIGGCHHGVTVETDYPLFEVAKELDNNLSSMVARGGFESAPMELDKYTYTHNYGGVFFCSTCEDFNNFDVFTAYLISDIGRLTNLVRKDCINDYISCLESENAQLKKAAGK